MGNWRQFLILFFKRHFSKLRALTLPPRPLRYGGPDGRWTAPLYCEQDSWPNTGERKVRAPWKDGAG